METVKRRSSRLLRRVFALCAVTLLSLLLTALGVLWVLERGPSPTVSALFCRTVQETSALRWLSRVFLSDTERAALLSTGKEDYPTDEMDLSLIRLPEAGSRNGPVVELRDVALGNCRGKLLIVHDPRLVILGTLDEFGKAPGLLLTEMAEKYDALAGINAGGFGDLNGLGNGGTPTGLVISEGQLLWGEATRTYDIVGLDSRGLLIVGNMSGQAALECGIRWGVSFTTHDGNASALVINGDIQTQNLAAGINPRTAIGQTAEGDLLLLVLDGRSARTFGASLENICDIMLSYGAITVGNLDGGSSSVMVYDGEIVNHCASVTGPRAIPTAFLVLKEAAHDD